MSTPVIAGKQEVGTGTLLLLTTGEGPGLFENPPEQRVILDGRRPWERPLTLRRFFDIRLATLVGFNNSAVMNMAVGVLRNPDLTFRTFVVTMGWKQFLPKRFELQAAVGIDDQIGTWKVFPNQGADRIDASNPPHDIRSSATLHLRLLA